MATYNFGSVYIVTINFHFQTYTASELSLLTKYIAIGAPGPKRSGFLSVVALTSNGLSHIYI